MIEKQHFQLISKALNTTQKSLEEQMGDGSWAIHQIDQAREDMKKALAHLNSIDNQMMIETLFDKVN